MDQIRFTQLTNHSSEIGFQAEVHTGSGEGRLGVCRTAWRFNHPKRVRRSNRQSRNLFADRDREAQVSRIPKRVIMRASSFRPSTRTTEQLI